MRSFPWLILSLDDIILNVLFAVLERVFNLRESLMRLVPWNHESLSCKLMNGFDAHSLRYSLAFLATSRDTRVRSVPPSLNELQVKLNQVPTLPVIKIPVRHLVIHGTRSNFLTKKRCSFQHLSAGLNVSHCERFKWLQAWVLCSRPRMLFWWRGRR